MHTSKTHKSHLHPEHLTHLHDAFCEKILGKGSSGTVKLYKCCENNYCSECFVVKKFNRPFSIIKYLSKIIGSSDRDFTYNKENSVLEKIVKEYKIGILLNHINIIKTLDIDRKDLCIFFEYCPGSDLFDIIDKKQLKLHQKLEVFNQVVSAIDYLHEQNIAHLDIKPENILYDHELNCVKLFDFGNAFIFKNKLTQEKITIKGLHGTMAYLAPEEFLDESYDPDKVDIWALGVLLYVLLFNEYPWKTASKKDLRFNYFTKTCFEKSTSNFIFPFELLQLDKKTKTAIPELFKLLLQTDFKKRSSIKDILKITAEFSI